MSEQWYCPQCGPVENPRVNDTDHLTWFNCPHCPKIVTRYFPPFVLALQERIALLEKVAEAVLEFNGSSGLASVRAWNTVKSCMSAAGYNVTKEHILLSTTKETHQLKLSILMSLYSTALTVVQTSSEVCHGILNIRVTLLRMKTMTAI
jgi:hypothetical protein